MNANPNLDRREGDRVPYAAPVMIVRAETAWFAQLFDISPGGCGVYRPEDFDLGQDDLIRLFFYQGVSSAAVSVQARVAHVGDNLVGIEYHDMQTVPPSHPDC